MQGKQLSRTGANRHKKHKEPSDDVQERGITPPQTLPDFNQWLSLDENAQAEHVRGSPSWENEKRRNKKANNDSKDNINVQHDKKAARLWRSIHDGVGERDKNSKEWLTWDKDLERTRRKMKFRRSSASFSGAAGTLGEEELESTPVKELACNVARLGRNNEALGDVKD
jgi:hypothetical protein